MWSKPAIRDLEVLQIGGRLDGSLEQKLLWWVSSISGSRNQAAFFFSQNVQIFHTQNLTWLASFTPEIAEKIWNNQLPESMELMGIYGYLWNHKLLD